MKPSPRDSAATRKLLHLLNDKATGRLEVGAGGSTLSIYVLHGEVVAAVSADDERQLLHLLRLRSDLPDKTLTALEATQDTGQSVFGDLLMANPDSLDELLGHRFRQNLCDYVASLEKPTYAPQKGVFVDNIQMGHESRPLVEACCAFATKAQRIDPDLLLLRGKSKPRTHASRIVASLLSDEPQSVYALSLRIPLEPTTARCLLVDLVTEGVARVPGAAHLEPEPEVAPEPLPEVEPEPLPGPEPLPEPAPPMESIHRPTPTTLIPGDDDLESEDGVVEMVDDGLSEPEAPKSTGALDDHPPDDAGFDEKEIEPEHDVGLEHGIGPEHGTGTENVGPEHDIETEHDTGTEDHVGPEDNEVDDFDAIADEPTDGEGAPRSLAAWLADATHVDEDELDIFSDHDHDRGATAEGAFSTETHNLDKIDVTNFDEDEFLEAEEAPSAPRFSAPVLGEEAAEAKIDVASDMLRRIVAAFDSADGSGAGQAAMQLLIDGAPPKFVPLLTGLKIGDDGGLSTGRVLANVYERPATEHRKLLNDGLLNLMERALSKAADELPDDLFDALYEGVAGYKQRLGL